MAQACGLIIDPAGNRAAHDPEIAIAIAVGHLDDPATGNALRCIVRHTKQTVHGSAAANRDHAVNIAYFRCIKRSAPCEVAMFLASTTCGNDPFRFCRQAVGRLVLRTFGIDPVNEDHHLVGGNRCDRQQEFVFVKILAGKALDRTHAVDSSEIAFKIAGSMAFQDACKRARPVLLEPVMDVEVVTPEDYMGDVIGDITSRRGRVQQMEARGNAQVIACRVPLSEMFGYATDLRSVTQGRATYTMQFSKYEQAPKNVSEEVVAKAAG